MIDTCVKKIVFCFKRYFYIFCLFSKSIKKWFEMSKFYLLRSYFCILCFNIGGRWSISPHHSIVVVVDWLVVCLFCCKVVYRGFFVFFSFL